MSKPDWKDAPEWANWLAADLTIDAGRPECWVWFEHKPRWNGCGWIQEEGRYLQTIYKIPLLNDSESSLAPRP